MAKYSSIKYDIQYTTEQATQYQTYFYTSDSNQSLFRDSDDYGNVLSYSTNRAQVFINGFAALANVDYSTNDSGNTITLDSAANFGDEILISVIK